MCHALIPGLLEEVRHQSPRFDAALQAIGAHDSIDHARGSVQGGQGAPGGLLAGLVDELRYTGLVKSQLGKTVV